MKVPIFGGFLLGTEPTGNRLKALLRGISLSEYGSEVFQVGLRRLSEYGSVACLVEIERPTLWSGFPADIPDPYAQMPRGQKVSPHHGDRGRRKAHFLMRTSTIFGEDIYDPKDCRKALYKKVCVELLAPKKMTKNL